jgi:hypothetical protein
MPTSRCTVGIIENKSAALSFRIKGPCITEGLFISPKSRVKRSLL